MGLKGLCLKRPLANSKDRDVAERLHPFSGDPTGLGFVWAKLQFPSGILGDVIPSFWGQRCLSP